MSSREWILEKIRANKPEPTSLPESTHFERNDIDLVQHFTDIIKFVGGRIGIATQIADIVDEIRSTYPETRKVAGNTQWAPMENIDWTTIVDPHQLSDLDLFIYEAPLAVAENGAVWVPSQSLMHRVLPFITQHMVFIVPKSVLVWNMHQAYSKLSMDAAEGYGVFISGPSKTADIEQSLVIGAHGSRSLTVFVV